MIAREFSSGGVVYRRENDEVLWLVRKTVASKLFPDTHWMLPKGWIDDESAGVPGPMASGRVKADEESLQKTAIREVEEEGGVKARIITKIGTAKYFYKHPKNGQILKFVTFYLMEWVSNLPQGFDGETSEVAWLPFDEAVKQLSFAREKDTLKEAWKKYSRASLV